MSMNTSRRISLIILAALLAMLPLGWIGETYAQGGTQGTAPGTGGMQQQRQHPGGMSSGMGSMQQQQVQGTIRTIDPSGRTLTLEDGTQLTIPPSANIPQGMLREGAMVKASFEERGGQKVVTELEVEDSRK